MNKTLLKEALRREVELWSQKGLGDLRAGSYPATYDNGKKGAEFYQTEVTLLEDEPGYVHIGVSVDDGGWRAFLPMATSFIVHADGRVEK